MAKSKKRFLLSKFVELGLCAQLFCSFEAYANTAKVKDTPTVDKPLPSKKPPSCEEIFLQEFSAHDASLAEFVERLESAIKRRGLNLDDQLRELTLCNPTKIPKSDSAEALFYTRALYFYRAGVRFLSDSRSARQGMSSAARRPIKIFLYQGETSNEVYADLDLTASDVAALPKLKKNVLDKKLTKIKTSEAMKNLIENEADFYDLLNHWNTERLVLDLFLLLKNKRKNICEVKTLQQKCSRDPTKKGVELYDASGKKCSNLVTKSTCPYIKSEQQVLVMEAGIFFTSYLSVIKKPAKITGATLFTHKTQNFIEQLQKNSERDLKIALQKKDFFIEWQLFESFISIK